MRRSIASFAVAVLTFAAARNVHAQGAAPSPEMPPESKGMTPSPSADVPPPASEIQPASTTDENDTAGWHGGLFYLRSKDDNFRLYFQGRAQIDMYNYFGPGVTDMTGASALKSTLFLRRIRPELTGEFMKNWQWMLAGDWGATSNDAAQAAQIKALATDVFINYRNFDGMFNVQVGQYDAPFTMENRTSDKYIPFMERSLAVRVVGIPTNKEIGAMVWGELTNKLFFYSVGLFNGDGQGRLNPDNRGDVMARAFVHPLAPGGGPLKDLQIGASFRYGMRDKNQVIYDYNSFTTQGNWKFWGATYKDATGRTLHVLPANAQVGYAFELRIPYDQYFELFGEFVGINNQTREAVDTFQGTNSERFGRMKGFAYYAALAFWPMGGRDINGAMGYENPSHLDLKKPDTTPKQALQLLLKFEQMDVQYIGADVSGTAGGYDGHIKANVFEVGANYWLTKHLRFSVNYAANMFPDSATADNKAVAPGNALAKGVNDDAKTNAHILHELLFRAAVAF